MRTTITFDPDPSVGMVPLYEMIRDRMEPCGAQVRELDAFHVTVEGEFDDIVAGLRSLDGRIVRRAGSHGVLHLHIVLGEFDTTDPMTATTYDAVCDEFARPHELQSGRSGIAL